MNREYYFCGCRLNEKDWYFIWFSDEEDGVHLNPEGDFVVFDELKELVTYSKQQKLLMKDEEPVFYDLDKLEKKMSIKKFKVDCVEFLNVWNLFDDFSRSIKGNFDSDRKTTEKIYEKLFWGNNLPVLTPEGKFYEPIWSKKEFEIIRAVLLHGIKMFRSNLKYIN